MAIKARIRIDDDRWEKRPFAIEFDDSECQSKHGKNYLYSREECYAIINKAKSDGFDIDDYIEEYFV